MPAMLFVSEFYRGQGLAPRQFLRPARLAHDHRIYGTTSPVDPALVVIARRLTSANVSRAALPGAPSKPRAIQRTARKPITIDKY